MKSMQCVPFLSSYNGSNYVPLELLSFKVCGPEAERLKCLLW